MTDLGVSQIQISGLNPRTSFDPAALDELKQSIQEHGILEPLVVRPYNGGFQLVAGERRYRAAKELGLVNVPVVIRELSDRQMKEIMLLENLQREDLTPLEEAASLQQLLQEDITQEALGKRLGKSQGWIANRLRLLQAPQELKDMIISREITPKHVLSLVRFSEYPVLHERIMPRVKEDMKRMGEVTVQHLEGIIENEIVYDWDAGSVLNLGGFPDEYCQFYDIFDFSKCKGCKDIYRQPEEEAEGEVEEPEEGEEFDGHYCLNRRCWADKMNIAKQAWEKERAERASDKSDDSGNGDVVDTAKLNWGEYKNLKYVSFDKTECNACKSCKNSTHNDPVCVDMACLNKKENAYNRAKQKEEREEERKAWEMFDSRVADLVTLDNKLGKWLLENLAEYSWDDATRTGLEPWHKTKRGEEIDFKKVPEKDRVKAMSRIIVARIFVGRKPTVETMNNILKGMGV